MEKFIPEKFFPSKREKEPKIKKIIIKKEALRREGEEKFEISKEEKPEIKEELEKRAEAVISEYFSEERENEKWEEFLPLFEKIELYGGKEIARIKMEDFSSVYLKTKLENDLEYVNSMLKRWQREKEAKESLKKKEIEILGGKLELLVEAIFCKFCYRTNYLPVRSAFYDDFKNGIDHLILEKGTGNIVCFFDVVADIKSERFRQKLDKMQDINLKGEGATIDYGVKIVKTKEGKLKPVLGKIDKIPIFCLALNEEKIKEANEKLSPSLKMKTDYEKEIFNYFLETLHTQIKEILLRARKLPERLDPTLKKRILDFYDFFKKIK